MTEKSNDKNAFGLTTKTSEHTEAQPAKKQLIELKKLLLEAKSDEVIQKWLAICVNDEHPQQMAAIKMAIDRMLPISEFDDEGKGGGIKTVIIDRSCGGKVIIKTSGGSIEMDTQEYLGSPETFENGE